MAERRRSFAPVLLAGLASAGLAAVAGNRPWVAWEATREADLSVLRMTGDDSATVPLAGALALVLLACWGVVLVTRGRFRRLVTGLGLLVAGAMAVTAVVGHGGAEDGLRDDLARLGIQEVGTRTGPWFWTFLACAVVSVAVTWLAFRWAPAWPEMGSRYDAPGGGPARPDSDLDLWRALDAGQDPTLTEHRPRDP